VISAFWAFFSREVWIFLQPPCADGQQSVERTRYAFVIGATEP
jgi:hypothetical protein